MFSPKKFEDSICIEDPEKIEELQICRYRSIRTFYPLEEHPTITIYSQRKLVFIDLMDEKLVPTIFPTELQIDDKILNFKHDKLKKCIYFHVSAGITLKCYGTKKDLKKPATLMIQHHRIVGMDLDPSNHYLYYYDKHEITVTDLNTFVKRTIYQTEDIIQFFKVDWMKKYHISKFRHIYISCVLPNTSAEIRILTISGDLYDLVSVPDLVDELFYDMYSIDIYTHDGVYRYDTETQRLDKIQNAAFDLKYLRVYSSNHFITSYGVRYLYYFAFLKNIRLADMDMGLDYRK
ncbi:hypothetical protein RF11_06987 [Thelohanellus kitauei]|uniref:Uncharacterized protein n=1 Tax=Thelohanellus kitauei TaxID=669202 RepID=A0A0C2MTL2_THEKT|nr:hypothetical protein RF11_06987 [Thelohanellus kitauei]